MACERTLPPPSRNRRRTRYERKSSETKKKKNNDLQTDEEISCALAKRGRGIIVRARDPNENRSVNRRDHSDQGCAESAAVQTKRHVAFFFFFLGGRQERHFGVFFFF